MKLRTRLILTYVACFGLLVLALGVATNLFVDTLFARLATQNIEAFSEEISTAIADQFDGQSQTFNVPMVESLGMSFVHQGYIVSVADTSGNVVWNARGCDMEQCVSVIQDVEDRMAGQKHSSGEFRNITYPLKSKGRIVGNIGIETYAPFFYSQSEADFITALNRFFMISGIVFLVLVIIVSVFVASSIAAPIRRTVEATKRIAAGDFQATVGNTPIVELQELAAAVNALAAALDAGEQYQKRLTGDIAHELRTPLTSLQGNVEAMIDGVWEPTTKRLESCHEEIVRIGYLAESLGQISLLEQDHLELRKSQFDFGALVESTVHQFEAQAMLQQVALKVDVQPVKVCADYDKMKQVLINVMTNALNYTSEGYVEISIQRAGEKDAVETSDMSGNLAEIIVRDSGIGIAPKELPHIFERFYRADQSRARNTGGAGIGLAVVKAIVEAHGGSVTAKSSGGKGTTITITVPQ